MGIGRNNLSTPLWGMVNTVWKIWSECAYRDCGAISNELPSNRPVSGSIFCFNQFLLQIFDYFSRNLYIVFICVSDGRTQIGKRCFESCQWQDGGIYKTLLG